jgi:ParB-like chromosome segregation protein Spo0J
MKVKIKDLEPNPYRDMNNYPMDENKVKSLIESIQQTGFWDNILSRKNGKKFQIAYGHHRLAAIREVFKPTDEVDIPVKELDDATMIKIMANENMEAWTALPRVIDETVRVTKQFLEAHPEEDKYHGTQTGFSKEVLQIADFLGWKEFRVKYSLERLKMIEDNTVDREALDSLPTERAARNFVTSVKEFDIPKEKQRAVVERYKETGSGERAMTNAVIEEVIIPKKKKESIGISRTIENEIKTVDSLVCDLQDKLLRLTTLYREVGGVPEFWEQINWHMKLVNNLNKTVTIIDSFILTNKK